MPLVENSLMYLIIKTMKSTSIITGANEAAVLKYKHLKEQRITGLKCILKKLSHSTTCPYAIRYTDQ